MTILGAVGEGLFELTLSPDEPGRIRTSAGGDAANACVMAARLGAHARLAGRVGEDPFGRRLLEFWRAEGIDTAWIRADGGAPTGIYANESRADGERRFTYWRAQSAGSRLEPSDLDGAFFAGLGVLLVTGVTLAISGSAASAADAALDRGQASGARIAFVVNDRPALTPDRARLARMARRSDIVIASQEDAEAVFGVTTPRQLTAALGARPQEVILTRGPEPVSVTAAGHEILQPVPMVTVHDAAGAGDAFAGGYLAARVLHGSPATAAAWGVAAAALSVQGYGCAAAYPTAAETREMAARLSPSATPRPVSG